jgi:hypothetical protein
VRDKDRNFLSPNLTGCLKRFGAMAGQSNSGPKRAYSGVQPSSCALCPGSVNPRGNWDIGRCSGPAKKTLWWIFTLLSAGGLDAAVQRYIIRGNWNVIAARRGFAIHSDQIHLNDRAGEMTADLIGNWLGSKFSPRIRRCPQAGA